MLSAAWIIGVIILLAGSFALVQSFSVSTNESQPINVVLNYASGSAFDTDDNGIETTQGVIDFSLNNSAFNFTPTESELCSLWHVQSQNTFAIKAYCQGSEDCCIIAQAVSPMNLTYVDSSQWHTFYLSYSQDGITTQNNLVMAQLWSANSSNITAAAFSDWTNLTATFTSSSSLSVSLSIPLNNAALNTSTANFAFIASENSNCMLGINSSISQQNVSAQQSLQATIAATLPDGKYLWNITCTDSQGSTRTSGTNTLTIDTQKPVISINQPQDGQITTSGAINLSFLASDSISSDLDCFSLIDTTPSFLGKVILNGTDYITTISVPQGTHTISAMCKDSAQNSFQTPARTFTYTSQTGLILTLEKNIVDLREPFALNIASLEQGQLQLTVQRFDLLNHAVLESYHSLSPPYRFVFNDTFFEGTYMFLAIQGSNQKNTSGSVSNSITATIQTTPSVAIAGREVVLNATVLGGTQPYQYFWLFNGSTYTSSQFSKSLESSYQQAFLTIKDANGNNKSFVRNFWVYNKISLTIKDSISGSPIDNAKTTINGEVKYSNISGQVSFDELGGTYEVIIEHYNHSRFTQISPYFSTQERIFSLTPLIAEASAPSISQITPDQGASVTSPVAVTAVVSSLANCSLYKKDEGSQWTLIETKQTNNNEAEFTEDFSEGSQSVRIECSDSSGRTTLSETRTFDVNQPFSGINNELSTSIVNDEDGLDKTINEIDSQIGFFNGLDKNQRELAEALDIYKTLDDAKVQFITAKRNISEAKFQELTEIDLSRLRDTILTSLQETRKKIPTSFNILESTESIAYATNQDIEALSEDLALASGTKLSAGQKNSYVKQIQALQANLGVTAVYGVAEITYLSGERENFGIVIKTISLKDSQSGMQLIESIPKTLATSSSQIKSKILYQVVKEDPILRFPVSLDNKLSYYISGIKQLDALQQAKTILVESPKSGSAKKSSATGFAILPQGVSIDFAESGKFWLIIAAGILMTFYLFHSLNLADYVLPDRRKHAETQQNLASLMAAATTAIERKSPEEAALRYTELQMLFEAMNENDQENCYPQLESLAMKINLSFAESVLVQIEQAIHYGHYEEAQTVYPALNDAYERLDSAHKSAIASRCMNVYKTIADKQ